MSEMDTTPYPLYVHADGSPVTNPDEIGDTRQQIFVNTNTPYHRKVGSFDARDWVKYKLDGPWCFRPDRPPTTSGGVVR